METYYFTFGFQHKHPETGEALRDYWVEVTAPSHDKATDIMNTQFGEVWAHQYHEKTFMSNTFKLFPKGCYSHFEY